MPGVPADLSRATIFQLEALVHTIRLGSYAAAASEMGISDKYRIIRAIERLSDNLQIPDLAAHVNDEPIGLESLTAASERLLSAIHDLERGVSALNQRPITLRCAALPSMVFIFLADAVRTFESAHAHSESDFIARIRFVDLESLYRRDAGRELLRQLASGLADVCIAPTLHATPDHVERRRIYSYRLIAAIDPVHPLRQACVEFEEHPAIPIGELTEYPLLVSPLGHRSRTLLIENDPAGTLRIELESTNSMARAALGTGKQRVPIIASDALSEHDYDPTWPAILSRNGVPLQDSHDIFWRTDLHNPFQLLLNDFVDIVHRSAKVLRNRPGGDSSN